MGGVMQRRQNRVFFYTACAWLGLFENSLLLASDSMEGRDTETPRTTATTSEEQERKSHHAIIAKNTLSMNDQRFVYL